MEKPEFIISLASIDDFSEILKLSLLLDPKANGDMSKLKEKIMTAVKNNYVWVAQIENKIVGHILCRLFDDSQKYFPNSIFIDELIVDKECRNMGIGKELIQIVLKNNFPEEYKYFSLTHDLYEPKLSQYYEKFGFREVGNTDAGNTMMTRNR